MRDLQTIVRDNAKATLRAARILDERNPGDSVAACLRLEVHKACAEAGIVVPDIDAAQPIGNDGKSEDKPSWLHRHTVESALDAQ